MKTFRISQFLSWTFAAGMLFTVLGLTLSACSPRCDPHAIADAVNLRIDLPALMDKAKTRKMPADEAERMLKNLGDAVARATATPRNKDAAEMWRLLRDDIVQPFFNSWKDKGKLDADYVRVSKEQVERSLGSIARAETSKRGGCSSTDVPPPPPPPPGN